jgi:LacI family transcriptional regulator
MGKGVYIRQKKITLADVAREAGCSVSAVSFVINRSHPISEDLQKRIHNAIEKLNYHPYGCHELPPRQWIALITRGPADREYMIWVDAIQKRGYYCRNCCIPENVTGKDLLQTLSNISRDNQLAGIVNLHSFIHSVDLLRRCKNIPSVIFAREGSMLSDVTLPFTEFGKLAAKILLERRHRKIGMIFYSTCSDQDSKLNLYSAFTETVSVSGCVENLPVVGEKSIDPQLHPLLDQAFEDGVTAFFIPDGRLLIESLLRWAYRRRLFIPDDFSLLIQDLGNFSRSFAPPLSSISWPLTSMAEATIDALIAKIASRRPESVVFHPIFDDSGSISTLP